MVDFQIQRRKLIDHDEDIIRFLKFVLVRDASQRPTLEECWFEVRTNVILVVHLAYAALNLRKNCCELGLRMNNLLKQVRLITRTAVSTSQ